MASGTIGYFEATNGEMIYLSGKLTKPEPGRFFFQKQTNPGVAGEFVGLVEFPGTDRAYRIEPSGPAGAPELVERAMGEVLCQRLPVPTNAPIYRTAQLPPLNPGNFPNLPPPVYQNGISVLESLHGATAVIYLDFQGGYTPSWGGVTFARPDVSNEQIREVWQRVAEDFMPFNINLTTDLKMFQNAPPGKRQHVIITPTKTASPEAGGIANIGSFNYTGDIPCWVFETSGKACAEACSHEIGHTLGLSHEGQNSAAGYLEYFQGDGTGDTSWAPIMGVGYYRDVSQWCRGEYLYANNHEDELAIIATENNTVAYRPDDTGDTLATSRYLELYGDYSASAEGVIERTADTDAFRFSTLGGVVSLRADPVNVGPDLALAVSLYDANDLLVASNSPQDTLWAALSTNVSAGTYTFRVTGTGRGDPLTNGFSTYASLGYYAVTGSVTNAQLPDRFAIPEHATNGTIVGNIMARETGIDPLSYSIVSGNYSNTFSLDDFGVLVVADNRALDYTTLANQTQLAVQFELFVNIADLVEPGLSETNRRVVVAVLPVLGPPVINQQPQSLTVTADYDATFNVSASADQALFDPLTYQWFFNGMGIVGATTSGLVIAAAQEQNAGDYTVVVSNFLGAVTSSVAVLNVTPAPDLVAWGWNDYGQTNVPAGLNDVVQISAGAEHNLALLRNGTVVAWGAGAQTNVPTGLADVVAVAAGASHSLALKRDGTVAAWGKDDVGQTDVPSNLSNVVAIAAGGEHSLALNSDGGVAAWGFNYYGQCNVPLTVTNVVAIAAGSNHSLALRGDGTVVAWGDSSSFQVYVPANLSNVVSIAAGVQHSLALTADGQLAAWGKNLYGQTTIHPLGMPLAAIADGGFHNLVLLPDGSVIGWGAGSQPTNIAPNFGQSHVPAHVTHTAAIAAGWAHSLLLRGHGAPFITEPPIGRIGYRNSQVAFHVTATGELPLYYQWQSGTTNLPSATNQVLILDDAVSEGDYQVTVSNALGVASSASARLTLVDRPPTILVQPLNQKAYLGGQLQLQVLADGSKPLFYQWRLNGADLPGATAAVLTLEHLVTAQSGYYSVVVSNAGGSVSSVKALIQVSQVAAWGDDTYGQTEIPDGLDGVIRVAGGYYHSLALRSDRTVVAWGLSGSRFNGYNYGQTTVPPGITNAIAVAAGGYHSLALQADGTVVAWGAGYTNSGFSPHYGQSIVPSGLSDVVAIAAGVYHSLALKSDGSLVVWGGQPSLPLTVPPQVTNIVAIASWDYSISALRADSVVITWGGGGGIPIGFTNLIAIAPNVGLTGDGRAISTPGLLVSGLAEVAGGSYYQLLARRTDGTVATWGGTNFAGLGAVPPGLTNAVSVSCGRLHNLVALGDGSLQITAPPSDRKVDFGRKTLLTVLVAGAPPVHFQWRFNGANLDEQTNSWLRLSNLKPTDAGDYSVVVSNPSQVLTSAPAHLSVHLPSTWSIGAAVDSPGLAWNSPGAVAWFGETNITHDGYAAAQSGVILDNQQSTLQTIVYGPGAVSFWWKVSSEQWFDFLNFAVNGRVQAAISGEVDWQFEQFNLPGGSNVLSWTYAKDPDVSFGLDAGWLDEVTATTNPPVIVQQPLGVKVPMGTNILLWVVAQGSPPLSYQWYKSGISVLDATGSVLRITNATRHDSGAYAAAVTDPGGTTLSSNAVIVVTVPQVLGSAGWLPGQGFSLVSQDADGAPLLQADLPGFAAQTSTNLVDWTTLSNSLTLSNGALLLVDPDSGNSAMRFYRIRDVQ
jgi:alpha-tubulin suppressor-like RCC1 family protein